MSIEAPRTSPSVYSDVEDLFALVEFYHALPTEAILATLKARGLQEVVRLEGLADALLVSLAIHTHTPRWHSLWGAHRPPQRDGKRRSYAVMVDLPL